MSAIATQPRAIAGSRPVDEYAIQQRKPDYWILAAVVSLALVGVVMVYSASYAQALAEQAGDPNPNPAVYALNRCKTC